MACCLALGHRASSLSPRQVGRHVGGRCGLGLRGGRGLGCLRRGGLLACRRGWGGRGRGGQALLLPHHASPLHAGHPPAQHLGLLEPVLQLLLPELLLDVEAEGHGALVLLAVLGVVAAQGDELFADGAAAVGLALAALGVLHHPLHLLAGRQRAVGVAALAGVHQRLDAALDAQAAGVSGALRGGGLLVVALVIKPQPELLHLVVVVFSVVAGDTQVIILGKTGAGQHSKIQAIQKHLHILLGLKSPILEKASLAQPFKSDTRPHLACSGPHTGPGVCPQASTTSEPPLRYLESPSPPRQGTHLTHGAMPASLHVVLALVAGVDKAVLALGVQLNQHAHGGPLGSSQ